MSKQMTPSADSAQLDEAEAELRADEGAAQELATVRANWGAHLEAAQLKAERIVGLQRFLFTWAILADVTTWGYGERWCYHDRASAQTALDAWDGEGEPNGWHRHLPSGRRRDPDGVERVQP
jgi:hypothetical protein